LIDLLKEWDTTNSYSNNFRHAKIREQLLEKRLLTQEEIVEISIGKRVSLPANSAFLDSQLLVVRGEAGSGKTVFMQWLAVRSASQSFEKNLSSLNNTIPFFIRLRQFPTGNFPSPENFVTVTAPAIAALMPNGWAHENLYSGKAIVLIDGVDEVPVAYRDDVKNWLRDLVSTFPKARFIVTSRPSAISEGWLALEKFDDAELETMSFRDIYAFVDHWHNAVKTQVINQTERNELKDLADNVKHIVQTNQTIRNLATTPLLCAMICALHRDRKQNLPSDRIELYQACIAMLLERRDRERRIKLSDYPELNFRQKHYLMMDLAYWMFKNGWTQLTIEKAEQRINNILRNMNGLPENITGHDVLKLFIDRSGLLRQPVVGIIDFSHRTFQEFLVAESAVAEGDFGLLTQNVLNDAWQEVIILVCGLANPNETNDMLAHILNLGDNNIEICHKPYLLAVACLETALEVSEEIKLKIKKNLSKLIPPSNMWQAKQLASAGTLVVSHLGFKNTYPESTAAACAHCLRLIASYDSLAEIETYANDMRPSVLKEIIEGRNAFDTDEYVQRVLSHVKQLETHDIFHLDELQFLPNLSFLHLHNTMNVLSLDGFQNLTKLESLALWGCNVTDFSNLSKLLYLRHLELRFANGLIDLEPIASLVNLQELNLSHCNYIYDLTPLKRLKKINIYKSKWLQRNRRSLSFVRNA
jgi:hypothetical protein